LVDPGGDTPLILDLIKRMGCTVTAILVTHAHIDHILSAQDVRV
jgi:hydroxyacylglutathione hydrolase